MKYGIPENSMEMILQAIKRKPEIEKAAIFSSRAMGNHKNGSDVDIVLFGSSVTRKKVNDLNIELNEELPLPYYFDVICFDLPINQELKDSIIISCKIFYEKPNLKVCEIRSD